MPVNTTHMKHHLYNRLLKIYIFSALTLSLALGVACSKQANNIEPDSLAKPQLWTGDTVKLESDYMAFKNREVWDNTLAYLRNHNDSFLDAWESHYSFTSYRTAHSNDSAVNVPDDPFFETVMSPYHMVRIGDSIFNVDESAELVYVLKTISESGIISLRQKSIIPGVIDTFSTDYEVLWPETGAPDGGPILSVLACGGAGKGTNRDLPLYYNNNAYEVYLYSHYKRHGVYYTVVQSIEHKKIGQNKKSSKTRLLMETYNWYWKVKGTCTEFSPSNTSYEEYNVYDLRRASYGSSRALSDFHFETVFEWDEVVNDPSKVNFFQLDLDPK